MPRTPSRGKTKWVYVLVVEPSFPTRHNEPIILRVSASNDEEAKERAKSKFAGSTRVISVRRVKTLEENCLDILWESHSDLYLKIWEPDITTKEFLRKLKKISPGLYEGFMKW